MASTVVSINENLLQNQYLRMNGEKIENMNIVCGLHSGRMALERKLIEEAKKEEKK